MYAVIFHAEIAQLDEVVELLRTYQSPSPH